MSDALVSTREEQAAIAKIEAAGKALAEAVELPEVKDIRDKAEAIRSYLRQQKSGLQAQNAAAILKIKAERRLGAMLRDMEKNAGGRPAANRSHDVTGLASLSALGINRMASHRWQTIASVPEEKFEEYLAQADTTQEEITSAGAYRLALRLYNRKLTQPSELPAGVFSCIEADPPWALDASEAKSAVGQYTVMDLESIKAMGPDVQARAAENSHLWLWAINPMLPEAFDVMAAWGFDYKGCLTWVKTNGFGTGHYLRGATEHCLLGVRGTLACLRNDQRTYFEATRTDHSRKPEGFYDILETLSPGPRLRLFARSQRDGWESWGDEA